MAAHGPRPAKGDASPRACARWICERGPAVALTGAGMSTAAGIPDFRGPQGLYVTRRYDPERVFELSAFLRDPSPFFEFSRDFLEVLDSVQPTVTHRVLAALERVGLLDAVVTQNIDALHQEAGSQHVVEVHGSYWSSRCLSCARSYDSKQLRSLVLAAEVARCDCGGVVKPDVVFFGEPVLALEEAADVIRRAGLLLVLGSSLSVFPAAWLPEHCAGTVLAVNLGEVGLRPGPDRFVVEAELDAYFGEVAALLELEI
jgi:NAD-dependent deacetylase